MRDRSQISLLSVLSRRPDAAANIRGSDRFASIRGTVRFYQTGAGVVVYTQIQGLPRGGSPCGGRIFAFHIHEGQACTGNRDDPFADVGGHYNPAGCEHPYHAGDMPPLFGNDGYAVSAFLTNRFTIREILGKTVIIHNKPDDFTTQPSGGAGTKIACGEIRRDCCFKSVYAASINR